MTSSAFLNDLCGSITGKDLKGSKAGSRKATHKLGRRIHKMWPIRQRITLQPQKGRKF